MMKLLMVTQKIDKDDGILGVYHEWAREIAKSFDGLSVICLYEGRNELPESIKVFSLGKESLKIKNLKLKILIQLNYAVRFYCYILRRYKDYDTIFVHMNPVYVVLGFLPWRIMGKRIFMWYAHPAKNIFVRLAYLLCDKIITSVPEAFYARGKKVVAIGQGIDTNLFRNSGVYPEINTRILYLGRISPAKRADVLLGAVRLLNAENINLSVSVVGDPSENYCDKEYYKKLHGFVEKNNLKDVVTFTSPVPNYMTPGIYNKHSIFVNLSPTGYFDKTVIEAMASECVVVASNEAYRNVFPRDFHELLLFKQDDAKDLAEKIRKILALASGDRNVIGKRLRKIVERDHSIFTLGERLRSAFEQII